MQPARDTDPYHRRHAEDGRVKVVFFPGCLVLSIVLSIVGTVLINVLIRLLN